MRGSEREQSARVALFLAEVEDLCRKRGLAITHEDDQGAFMVVPFDERDALRLREAFDESDPPKCGRPVDGATCSMRPGHAFQCRRRRIT